MQINPSGEGLPFSLVALTFPDCPVLCDWSLSMAPPGLVISIDDRVMYTSRECVRAPPLPLIRPAVLRTCISIQGCDLLLARMGLGVGVGGGGESREKMKMLSWRKAWGCQEIYFCELAQAPLLIKM